MASPPDAERWGAERSAFTNAEVDDTLDRLQAAELEVERLRAALRAGSLACEALAKMLGGYAGERP